jgi:hypothetical protein
MTEASTPQHKVHEPTTSEIPKTPEALEAEAKQMEGFAATVAHEGLAKVYTTQAELLRAAAKDRTEKE